MLLFVRCKGLTLEKLFYQLRSMISPLQNRQKMSRRWWWT